MSDQLNSKHELGVLQKLLEEIGWEPVSTLPGAFYIDFGPPHLPISTGLAAITQGTNQFVFYLNFGYLVSVGRRDEVLRFIARVNWKLIIGNFDLDLDDGHLRFKTSVDFDGIELPETLIRNALLVAMNTVDTYSDSLMGIAFPEKNVLRNKY